MKHTLADLKAGKLKGIKHLKISENITEFPLEIFELADTLEILDLSQNQLQGIPDDFSTLSKLKIFFASENPISIFPEVLGTCTNLEMIGFKACNIEFIPTNAFPPKLRWLILTQNKISSIPDSLGKCVRLQKCMLAGNQLKTLPETLKNCVNLELLRISANQFDQLPECVLKLPKLAWLATAGNPFCETSLSLTELETLEYSDFEIKEILGQGASGIIHLANYIPENKNYALKIYKNDITSDGYVDSEILATLLAGNHAHKVTVKALVKGAPDNKKIVAFELIPNTFYNLGVSPTFESCSRDVFASDFKLSSSELLKLCIQMCEIATHLHDMYIMHGDLYAHNTLIDKDKNLLFGDFGAGLYYKNQEPILRDFFEKLEVRAFGYFIDDLDKFAPEIPQLIQLKQKCLHEHFSERPNFKEILAALKNI
ncbi:MAG: leucine-rich repeat-containing protein kinase family protein [Cytophagales bacterium]